MGLKRIDEIRAERIALISVLTRKQMADDLGVGKSTLTNGLRRIEALTWC